MISFFCLQKYIFYTRKTTTKRVKQEKLPLKRHIEEVEMPVHNTFRMQKAAPTRWVHVFDTSGALLLGSQSIAFGF